MDRTVGPETESDLLKAIAEAWGETPDTSGFLTVAEISEAMGWSRDKTLVALRRIRKMGRLVSGRKYVENIAGQNQPLPAYRIRKDDAE